MSKPLESSNSPENNASEFSRRTFIGASAALVGAYWLARESSAQNALRPVVPHEFGLRSAPTASRQPLVSTPFLALPLGSVRARGWLFEQLRLQKEGLTGHAEEVLPATAPDSAWKGGDGEDWEKGPYYLKGLVTLAYTLDDADLKAKVLAWIEPILASARPDGFFGPKKNDDWWPRMVVTYLLRDYAEASDDKRVEPFLTAYYRYMLANLPAKPLREWGRARAGDEIDTVFWLYNRTGESFLLDLADTIARQAYPWQQIFTENKFLEYGPDFHPKHAVNVPQALKMPVVYSQRSGKHEDRAAYQAGIQHLMQDHGTAFGINTGTEMLSGRSAAEGVETCSTVEHMLSAETAIRILGDARIGDELELIAFNALPAAMSKDFKQHVYYTVSNNVSAQRGGMGYEEDYGDGRTPAPRSGFPCCCYNLHMGWPKLAQNSWAATADGGLAVMAYVPSQVSAQVAGGQTASIVCETTYPFEETIRLSLNLNSPAKFPLQLRIPGWCAKPQLKVNGRLQTAPKAGAFTTINRQWKDGDRVELNFPMPVEVRPGVNNSVSIKRGPLVYALGLNEKWSSFEQNKVPGFDSYEVSSDSPWNFALVLEGKNSFQAVKKTGTKNPFETGKSPVALKVQARPIEGWRMRADGRNALDPPVSPVTSNAPLQTLELVPFGSQMLRVTDFPFVGKPKNGETIWTEDFGGDYSQRWVAYRGSLIRNGQLFLPREAKAVAIYPEFADLSYEADVTVGDKGDAGLLFRVNDATVGTDGYLGYYAGINAEKGQVVLGKSSNRWTELGTAPKNIQAGTVHRLRVEARGSQIRVFVNDMGNPVLEVLDESHHSGGVGLRSYADKAYFGKLSARKV